jgi:hypothetical protein
VRQRRHRAPSNVRTRWSGQRLWSTACCLWLLLGHHVVCYRHLGGAAEQQGTKVVMILPSLPPKAKSKLSFDSSYVAAYSGALIPLTNCLLCFKGQLKPPQPSVTADALRGVLG